MKRRLSLALLIALALCMLALRVGNSVAIALESSAPSRSIGTPSHGRLEHGKRLPSSGANFAAYSRLGTLLGRNTVHGEVRRVVLAAYAELAASRPETRFVYGESGWPRGGRLRPHRTHQAGISVDFLVPVRTASGRPAVLPTWPWHRFGYGVEFDATGRYRDLEIDFDAVAAHLLALDRHARANGMRIDRVIFAPELMERLRRAEGGQEVVERLPFMKGRVWIRHDEHYHVDFGLSAP
jgi:penicillin-insensitive murein DD-endopeptidase